MSVAADFKPKSDFLRIVLERDYVHQCSDLAGLDDKAAKGEVVAYVGYDCTAPSLHVGSLISIMMLHWLQQTGNKPVPLMGGGRPVWATRPAATRRASFSRPSRSTPTRTASSRSSRGSCASAEGSGDAVMIDNAEWLTKLNYIDFLRMSAGTSP